MLHPHGYNYCCSLACFLPEQWQCLCVCSNCVTSLVHFYLTWHKIHFLLTPLGTYISVQNASCAVEIEPLLSRFQNHPVVIVVQQCQWNSSTWILRAAVYLHVFHQDGTCRGEGIHFYKGLWRQQPWKVGRPLITSAFRNADTWIWTWKTV